VNNDISAVLLFVRRQLLTAATALRCYFLIFVAQSVRKRHRSQLMLRDSAMISSCSMRMSDVWLGCIFILLLAY